MDGIYAVASSSSSVTYGNVISFIREMLKDKFPPNFFKYTNVTSEVAYRNIRRQLGSNTDNEMTKRLKPWLVVRPQINTPSGDMYLYDIPLTKNFDNIEYGVDKRHLFNLMDDKDNNFKILYKINRDEISFDVTITTATMIKQIDLYKYLVNHIVWDRPYTTVGSLEAMIPRDFVNFVGAMSRIDIMTDSKQRNTIPIMIQHLNKFASYPITYKMRNSTSLDEFFMYYNTELMIKFTDLSREEVSKKNMVDEMYEINFRVSVEFNLPSVFFLVGSEPKIREVFVSIQSEGSMNDTSDFIPLYTLNNLYNRYKPVIDNYKLYVTSIFKTQQDQKTKKDVLDISVLFEDNYRKVINLNNKFGMSMDSLLNIIIVKDNIELEKDKDWCIDWGSLNITIIDADDSATYRILIYTNMIQMNETIINLTEDDMKDKSKI